VTVAGRWELSFPANSGAPPHVVLDRLISWSAHSEPGVKYFSGTATYQKAIQVPPTLLAQDLRLRLDLGQVRVLAQVALNGRDLGVLWKPPFQLDITEVAKAGDNALEVKVVNLWPNRLIGDEQLPDDCQWGPAQGENGRPLQAWPQWLLEGKPSPTGRFTFTTWKHWTKDSPLLESGLLGPVTLRVSKLIPLE